MKPISLLAAMAGLTALDWGVPVGGLFYNLPASASRPAHLFVECVRWISFNRPLARLCAASTISYGYLS